MRGLLLILITTLLLTSCSTIEDNSPALQGVRDSTLVKASVSRAVINDDGSLVIRGERGQEAINFLINTQGQNQITLGGQNNTNIATYTDPDGNQLTTSSSQASGEVNYTINGDNTVTGDFKFTAFASNFSDTVVFSKGFIFKVPILGAQINTPIQTEDDFFTARVNDVIFVPSIINRVTSNTSITVAGQTSETSMAIIFPIDSAPGAYDISSSGDFFATYTNQAGVSTSATGQLNIVSNDLINQVIVGEFSFDTSDGFFFVTDGEFTINY